MAITPLPTPPQTGQTSNIFVQNADNFFSALPTMVTELNGVISNLEGYATSASSSAQTATTKAQEASSSAQIATTKTQEASTSATNANSYKDSAKTYRDEAEIFRNQTVNQGLPTAVGNNNKFVKSNGTSWTAVTLVESDIPALAISKITNLQNILDGKSATTHTHSNATSSASGFMSAEDKTILNNLSSLVNSQNLIGNYPLDGNVLDYSGLGNNLTASNITYDSLEKCAIFNGSSSVISIPDIIANTIQPSGKFVLSLEFKTSDTQFALLNMTKNIHLYISSNDGVTILAGFVQSDGTTTIHSSIPITSGIWNNLLIVADGARAKFFLNNILISNLAYNGTIRTSPSGITNINHFGRGFNNDYYYNGRLRNVKFYKGV